jgi:hypothetical protein
VVDLYLIGLGSPPGGFEFGSGHFRRLSRHLNQLEDVGQDPSLDVGGKAGVCQIFFGWSFGLSKCRSDEQERGELIISPHLACASHTTITLLAYVPSSAGNAKEGHRCILSGLGIVRFITASISHQNQSAICFCFLVSIYAQFIALARWQHAAAPSSTSEVASQQ